jgi:hypothetical protein
MLEQVAIRFNFPYPTEHDQRDKNPLPLTYNVVRLFKLIHLSAIERARVIYAKE